MIVSTPEPDDAFFDKLERRVHGVALRGIHQGILKALIMIYATMLLSIWLLFARDRATDLDLAFATFVFTVYFSLVIGGITLSDFHFPGERLRSLDEYMAGPVDTNSGTMTGRAAAVQILFLPACIVLFITAFGIMVIISKATD